MNTFLSLLLLYSPNSKPVSAHDGNITSIPGKNEQVILTETYQLSYKQVFHLTSDVPVTVYRYTDDRDWFTSELIPDDEIWMSVKTNCLNYTWNTQTKSLDNGVISINLTANPGGETLQHIRPLYGNIEAEWYYTSFWCKSGYGNRRLRRSNTKQNVFQDNPDIVGDISELPPQQQEQPSCDTVAQIVYYGCKRTIKVDAPSLLVTTAHMMNEQINKTTDKCTDHYKGNIKPVKTIVRDSDSTVTVRTLPKEQCTRVVEGRPFIDDTGSMLQSEAIKSHQACWAHGETDYTAQQGLLQQNKHQQQHQYDHTAKYDQLALKWMKRSLGEHSSIASFAALTISLLTNNAPPELIRQSLHAALDEVNHATASFKMSSFLSREIVEPGPLPPSSIHFQHDVQTLAWRTFKEGCVDETISAVAAAAEASMHHDGNDIDHMMQMELSQIAMDEARHAALAFRTLQWACTVESQYCRDNIANYFDDMTVLTDLVDSRLAMFGDASSTQTHLQYMYSALLGSVTGVSTESKMEELCEHHVSTFDAKESVGIVNDVINAIVAEVLCGSGGDTHEAILDSVTALDQE
jgi:hypothetical protein